MQGPTGPLLVRCLVYGDLTRLASECRLDPFLETPVAEQYQALAVQARTRDCALPGGAHQCGSAWPHVATPRITDEIIQFMLKVEILFRILLRLQFVGKKMLDQGKRQVSGVPTD